MGINNQPAIGKPNKSLRDKFKRSALMKGEELAFRFTDPFKMKLYNYIIYNVKNHFGFEIEIGKLKNYPKKQNDSFMEWLKKYDKNSSKHISNNSELIDSEFMFKIEKGTYCYISSGKAYLNSKSEAQLLHESDFGGSGDTYIYIFGKKSYKHYKELKSIFDLDNTIQYSLKVTGSNYEGDNFVVTSSELKPRNMNTIYLENNVTNKIKTHIDNFLSIKSIYDERNLRYKTGILMEGEPGTGKTSLATAIATEYKSDLVVIDMNSFEKINTQVLAQTIDADDDMYVVLLEDIDCVIGDREDESIDKDEKSLVNKLLQFLDSSSSPSNVIFIATTNHPEKLDAAIKRDGRFDLIVEVKGIYEKKVIEMCKSFNISDKDINNIISEIGDNYPVNQSWLQNRILKTFENEDAVVI